MRGVSCVSQGNSNGASLLELMFSISMAATVAGIGVPAVANALDEWRTVAAARYVAARIGSTRLDAVRHSRATALRFEVAHSDGRGGGDSGMSGVSAGRDYAFVSVADGNGNGVRSAEIRDGIDTMVGRSERLGDLFPGVRFELMAGAPDADGSRGTGPDGVRIGSAQILTMSADGTSSSGTLYIRGRRSQYAVRVLGVTGRTRMLQYQAGNGTWINR